MSKLNDLIKELCPDGVEYDCLNSVLEYEQPTKYIVSETNYNDCYDTPVLTAGKTFILGYTNELTGIYQITENKEVIIFDDFTTSFHWVDFNFKIKSSAMKIITVNSDKNLDVSFRYIYHCMKNINYATVDHSRQWIAKYSNIKVPLPPLKVQEEIVRILDNFTELTAELTAELAARKKQYEYYKCELLNFGHEIVNMPLGDVAKIQRGASPRPISKFITLEECGVSWIKIGDTIPGSKYVTQTKQRITLEGSKKSRVLKKGDLIISNSMSFGRPYILNIDGAIHDGWASISDYENKLNSDFLYHFLSTSLVQNYWISKINSGSVSNLNAEIIKSLLIPVPPLEEQQRIVDILDDFDTICNDISQGLPAEIKARKQQYEYYRDLLLDFPILDKE